MFKDILFVTRAEPNVVQKTLDLLLDFIERLPDGLLLKKELVELEKVIIQPEDLVLPSDEEADLKVLTVIPETHASLQPLQSSINAVTNALNNEGSLEDRLFHSLRDLATHYKRYLKNLLASLNRSVWLPPFRVKRPPPINI